MRTRVGIGLMLLLIPAALWASGTLIYEVGSKASAQAGAFTARGDDASAVFYNPAGMAFAKNMQFSFNTTYINTDVKYQSPSLGQYKNQAQNFFIPSVFFTMPLTEKLAFGVYGGAPFNLATDWTDQFPGRFASRHAKIVTYNLRPALSIKFNDYNALAIGVDYYDSEINLIRAANTSALSTAINPSHYPSPPYPPGIPYYQYSEGSLDTWLRDQAWGWNISYMWKMAPWSFGAQYRSRAKFNYVGHTSFEVSPYVEPLHAYFPGQTTHLSIESVPAVAVMGFAYDNKTFTVEFDVQWTEWSVWDRSAAKFSTPTSFGGNYIVPPEEEFVFDWGNTWCWRLGFGYKLNEYWELRWGLLYDQAPVPDHTLSPVLPDQDRWSVQFGTGYEKNGFGFDWYVMYLKFKNANIATENVNRYYATGLPYVYLPGQGVIYPTEYPVTPDGKYKGTALLAGFQLNFKF